MYILTEAYHIEGKTVQNKIEKIEDNKSYKESHYIIKKS